MNEVINKYTILSLVGYTLCLILAMIRHNGDIYLVTIIIASMIFGVLLGVHLVWKFSLDIIKENEYYESQLSKKRYHQAIKKL